MLRDNPDTYGLLQDHVLGLLEGTFRQLGFDPLDPARDDPQTVLIRYVLIYP